MRTIFRLKQLSSHARVAGGGVVRWDYDRADRLAWRIDRGERDGSLNRWEARRLRSELNDIRSLQYRYMRDGWMNGWRRADLDRRYEALSQRIRWEKRDGDYRPGPYYR